jgi:hypothetical protein
MRLEEVAPGGCYLESILVDAEVTQLTLAHTPYHPLVRRRRPAPLLLSRRSGRTPAAGASAAATRASGRSADRSGRKRARAAGSGRGCACRARGCGGCGWLSL